jgi:pimeloyl-ACP methyl ester carboxylesterase
MAKKTAKNLADYITPLRMNGLKGRMLCLPAPKNKKKELLLIYGHHASIERMFGLAEDLNQYGAVTLPDLPGFGGMQSFYKIGEKPTIDNLADYLASFVKLRYKKKRVTIIAMSFGFVVVTRMLQKYPDLAKKVDVLVSVVGFAHKSDFIFSRPTYYGLLTMARLYSLRLPAWMLRHSGLTSPFITFTYRAVAEKHSKFKDASVEERDYRIAFEVKLWQSNDIRTHMYTLKQMLTLDLCNMQVDLPVYHVGVKTDRYFDNHVVEQHLRVIYREFNHVPTKLPLHAPTVVASAKDAAPFIPDKLRKVIARS